MFADHEPLFPPRPFWFASEELLTNFLGAEVGRVTQCLAKYPDLPGLFDAPEATVPQRRACFSLLGHRKVIDMVYDTFAGHYQDPPSPAVEESTALRRTYNLVAADAPVWVLEMHQVVERLPAHIYASLPEPLRRGGFNPDDAEQMQAIQSAREALNSIEQIQALIEGVLDQQLRRLESRWLAANVQIREPEIRGPKKRKGRRRRDKQRMRRDKLIAEIDDVAETIGEFLQLMDERKVKPQPTWSGWPGSWSQAYKDQRLRTLIHKDKSRALARVRRERSR